MFSYNQKFDVTCDFEELADVIRLGMALSGSDWPMTKREPKCKPAFKVILNRYCIGVGTVPGDSEYAKDVAEKGWTMYPFDYDPEIIAQIVTQWVKQQPSPVSSCPDGLEELGVRVRCAMELYNDPATQGLVDDEILDPNDCVLVFEPCMRWYPK